MKNDIVAKINSIGKVSRIVSRIAQIAALIGAIACFVVGVIFVFIPDDSVTSFNGTATGTIVFDEEKSKMFSFDEENDKMKFMGAELSFDTKETLNGNEREVEIHALAVNFSGKHFKALGIVLSFSGSLLLASLYVVFVFAVSLSKALETCESPFEENVLTAMKKLGYSFIPFGIIHIGLTGISAVTIILMIMLVIAMINIFSYGAKLQQESDDTV